MPVRIVTDSASDLTADDAAELGVEIVPLKIRFGDEEFVDRTELSVEDFYVKMATSEHLPSTAAPSPGDFEVVFRSLAEQGADAIVCVCLSMGLSATGEAAQNAAASVADTVDVTVFDSKSVSAGVGTQVRLAAAAAAAGAGVDEIIELLEDLRERTRVYGALDTLDNLKKGGRIGNAQALLGTMLSIKPCLDLSSGVVEEAGKQRTRKRAIAWLRNELADAGPVEELAVIHGQAPDFDDLLSAVTDLVDPSAIRIVVLGAVIGAHGGPRVLGLTWLASKDS